MRDLFNVPKFYRNDAEELKPTLFEPVSDHAKDLIKNIDLIKTKAAHKQGNIKFHKNPDDFFDSYAKAYGVSVKDFREKLDKSLGKSLFYQEKVIGERIIDHLNYCHLTSVREIDDLKHLNKSEKQNHDKIMWNELNTLGVTNVGLKYEIKYVKVSRRFVLIKEVDNKPVFSKEFNSKIYAKDYANRDFSKHCSYLNLPNDMYDRDRLNRESKKKLSYVVSNIYASLPKDVNSKSIYVNCSFGVHDINDVISLTGKGFVFKNCYFILGTGEMYYVVHSDDLKFQRVR